MYSFLFPGCGGGAAAGEGVFLLAGSLGLFFFPGCATAAILLEKESCYWLIPFSFFLGGLLLLEKVCWTSFFAVDVLLLLLEKVCWTSFFAVVVLLLLEKMFWTSFLQWLRCRWRRCLEFPFFQKLCCY
jgi:hypothetical protein